MKALAIITARSGSKGIPDKNIKLLNGKPLMANTIETAILSRLFDEIMVSTDSEQYGEIARKYGARVPFLRSDKTSGDFAGSWDVVVEVLENYAKLGVFYDNICLLQPTSPLREARDIVNAYDEYVKKKADAITSVCEVDYSPLMTMELPEDKSLVSYRKTSQVKPRQLTNPFYRLNGAIYIRRVTYENGKPKVHAESEYAYIMDRVKSVDIDTKEDFEYAEFLLLRRAKCGE